MIQELKTKVMLYTQCTMKSKIKYNTRTQNQMRTHQHDTLNKNITQIKKKLKTKNVFLYVYDITNHNTS